MPLKTGHVLAKVFVNLSCVFISVWATQPISPLSPHLHIIRNYECLSLFSRFADILFHTVYIVPQLITLDYCSSVKPQSASGGLTECSGFNKSLAKSTSSAACCWFTRKTILIHSSVCTDKKHVDRNTLTLEVYEEVFCIDPHTSTVSTYLTMHSLSGSICILQMLIKTIATVHQKTCYTYS